MSHRSTNGQPAGSAGALGELSRPLVRAAPLWLTALVVLYRPMACGLVPEPGSQAAFGMLLLAALFLWVCDGALSGTLKVRAGAGAALYVAFLLWGLVSWARGHNAFAGAQIWTLFATYGLTAFLVLHLTRSRTHRVFLASCFLATAVTLAAFAILHYALYRPAYATWLQGQPDYFKRLFGVHGAGFKDFYIRVTGRRAVGNFITSNQLAAFLSLGLFPLGALTAAAWRRTGGGKGRRRLVVLAATTAALLVVLCALALSRSKGAMVAGAFGLVVFAAGVRRHWLRRRLAPLAAGAFVLVVLFLAGQRIGLVPSWERFRASLGVRLNYWRVSAQMIRRHPLTGVGPGGWPEYYTMLKPPEYEETRTAHSSYIQIWSEMGTVALLLFALAWAVPGARALRGMVRRETPEGAAVAGRARLWVAGPLLAAGALAFNALFVGTFKPPDVGGVKLLQVAPWLVNVGLAAVWAGAFLTARAVFTQESEGGGAATERLVVWGFVAGLTAFLLHSGAEFTLRVPGLEEALLRLGRWCWRTLRPAAPGRCASPARGARCSCSAALCRPWPGRLCSRRPRSSIPFRRPTSWR